MTNVTSNGLNLKSLGFLAVAASMMTVTAPMAQAQSSSSRQAQVNLAPGTVIPVTLNTELSSNNSSEGDTFVATVDDSKQAYDNIMRGATVEGVVRSATPQENDKPGTLELAFTKLRLSDGQTFPISGVVTSLDTKDLKTRTDGVLEAKNTTKDNRGTYAGIGAGAGALASILGGGKIKIENIILGGIAGYGAATVLKGSAKVHDVDLKEGTPVGVMLKDRVSYYHRRSGTTTTHYTTGTRTSAKMKYYSYQGHPYRLNKVTGERVRLD